MLLTTLKKAVWAALLTSSVAAYAAPPDIAPHDRPVVDLTGTLSQDALNTLNAKAEAMKAKTGVEMAVLLAPGLNGEKLDDFTQRAATAWKLGDNDAKAALMVVDFKDHGVRLLGTRNIVDHFDANRANDVITNTLVPEFREGHIPQGISKTMDAVQAYLTGPALLFSQHMATKPSAAVSGSAPYSASATSSASKPASNGHPALRLMANDTLALGLTLSSLVLMGAFFFVRRVQSDRALRHKVMRAHTEKANSLKAQSSPRLQPKTALDKATAGKPSKFTGSLAKSRLSSLREPRAAQDQTPGEQA